MVGVMIDTHPAVGLADTDTDTGTRSDVGGGAAQHRVGLAQLRAAVTETAERLRALPGIIWQASGSDLGVVLGELDQLVAVAAAGRVAVTAEAVERGEVASSQCAGTAGWVAQHAPALAAVGGPGQLGKLVEQIGKPRLRQRDAVLAGELAVPVALVVVSEFDKLRGRVIPEARVAGVGGAGAHRGRGRGAGGAPAAAASAGRAWRDGGAAGRAGQGCGAGRVVASEVCR